MEYVTFIWYMKPYVGSSVIDSSWQVCRVYVVMIRLSIAFIVISIMIPIPTRFRRNVGIQSHLARYHPFLSNLSSVSDSSDRQPPTALFSLQSNHSPQQLTHQPTTIVISFALAGLVSSIMMSYF